MTSKFFTVFWRCSIVLSAIILLALTTAWYFGQLQPITAIGERQLPWPISRWWYLVAAPIIAIPFSLIIEAFRKDDDLMIFFATMFLSLSLFFSITDGFVGFIVCVATFFVLILTLGILSLFIWLIYKSGFLFWLIAKD